MTDAVPGAMHVHIRTKAEDWRRFVAASRATAEGLSEMTFAVRKVGEVVTDITWEVEDREKNGRLIEKGLPWVGTDGGLSAAGMRSTDYDSGLGDDAIRAIAIALGLHPQTVEAGLAYHRDERWRKANAAKRRYKSVLEKYEQPVRTRVERDVIEDMLAEYGWEWVPVMLMGSGTKMHLTWDELPEEALVGPVVIRCSSDEYVAVINGVLHHPRDATRSGTRVVYGYFCPSETRRMVAQLGAGS